MRSALCISLFVGLFGLTNPVHGAVQPVSDSDLTAALQLLGTGGGSGRIQGARYPDSSFIQQVKYFRETPVTLELLTPQAWAVAFAATQRAHGVELTPDIWNPEVFNSGLLLIVRSLKGKDDPHESEKVYYTSMNPERILVSTVFQVDSIRVESSAGMVIEPVWVELDSTQVALTGTSPTRIATDLRALLPVSICEIGQWVKCTVYTNHGERAFKLKAKDLANLR